MTSGLPFDDYRALAARLPEGNEIAAARVGDQFARVLDAPGSLGRVADLAVWLARWTGRAPSVRRPLMAIFAGNHGVAGRGVSPRPMEATALSVERIAAGGAAINQVCLAHDLGLKVFDLALHLPTGDITVEDALDERACAATMAFGMESVAGGTDLLCVGDLGVGGSTVAAALFAALFGGQGIDWVGLGSGADAAMVSRKAQAVDAALAFHAGHLSDPLEVLRRLGGREFAAIAGAVLAARTERVPVLLDGKAALAAAAVLKALHPRALDHCLLAQCPLEKGDRAADERLGLRPILDLGVTHGEGVGAAPAAGVVKASAMVSSGMAATL